MADTLLALIPTYGVWLILGALLLSCLAVPIPSSILVMAGGAFASAGDMGLWQVQLAAFCGFITGDQLAYNIARAGGSRFIERLRDRPKVAPILLRAEGLLARHGAMAVFISRTLLSPLGPYTGYLSGALRLHWGHFTIASVCGAVCWCLTYSLLGYFFADRVNQMASMLGNAIGFIVMTTFVVGLSWYLVARWRAEKDAEKG